MASDVAGVLDDLVNQFADPMSFLRELIQNAIDAGSGEIDIRVEHDPSRDMMIVHVNDFGEGMTREIVETKLTRLFSSGKDEDFTKIGRFGIGFVSVFAISPQIVCVDTGRAGEYWRVLFKPDRTFDLLALDQPVEGTHVRIFKPATHEECLAFTARSKEVVTYWCRHVEVPIFLNGERLNQPFELDAICTSAHAEQGTRLVTGWVLPEQANGGFFNRGLTLKDGVESDWPCVSFKIDSRYLEHTLTRDQVLKDRHYHKAHDLLDAHIKRDLVEALLQSLEHHATQPDSRAWYAHLEIVNFWLSSWGSLQAGGRDRRAIVRTLYGEALSVKQLKRLHDRGEVMSVRERSRLGDALQDEIACVHVPEYAAPVMERFYRVVCGGVMRALEDHWAMVVPSSRNDAPGAHALREEVRVMCAALGGVAERIVFADALGDVPDAVVMCPGELGEAFKLERLKPISTKNLLAARTIALRDEYTLWEDVLTQAKTEPEWAALLVVKTLLLQDPEGMSGEHEAIVTSCMVTRRVARLELKGGV